MWAWEGEPGLKADFRRSVGLDLLAPAVKPEGTDGTWRQREAPARADAQPRKQARRKLHAQAQAEGSAGARLRAQEAGAAIPSPPGRPLGLLAPPERPAAATPRRKGKAAAGSDGPHADNTLPGQTAATAACPAAQFYKGALSRITLRVSFRAGPVLLPSRPGRRARRSRDVGMAATARSGFSPASSARSRGHSEARGSACRFPATEVGAALRPAVKDRAGRAVSGFCGIWGQFPGARETKMLAWSGLPVAIVWLPVREQPLSLSSAERNVVTRGPRSALEAALSAEKERGGRPIGMVTARFPREARQGPRGDFSALAKERRSRDLWPLRLRSDLSSGVCGRGQCCPRAPPPSPSGSCSLGFLRFFCCFETVSGTKFSQHRLLLSQIIVLRCLFC